MAITDNLKDGGLREIALPLILFILVLGATVVAAQVGPKNLFVAVTISNNAPVVTFTNTSMNATVTLSDGTTSQILIQFNITDADGTSNINNAAVGVNITFNGVKRSNNTGNCANLGDASSTVRSYACTVLFYYYDNSSTLWDINLSAADNTGATASNSSKSAGTNSSAHNLTVSSLSAFSLVTPSVVSTANLGDSNTEITVVVNNTGNFDFTILNVTPFDLNASLTDFFKLGGNFSVNATASTGIGFGTGLVNNTPVNFSDSTGVSATLQHKVTSEADTKGNRTLYIYVDVPNSKGLSSGVTYNVSSAWQLFVS